MKDLNMPEPVPTACLAGHFREAGVPFVRHGRLDLGFGEAMPQYRFFEYALPGPGQTMGMFFEWHTADFFDAASGPHLAVGLRGPLQHDPHRGRGLAIGILASHAPDPAEPGRRLPLFAGCPEPPGGPAFFLEDFSINEGTAPVESWQLSCCKHAAKLRNDRCYRIDLHVSSDTAWAGVWLVEDSGAVYIPMGQTHCGECGPGAYADGSRPCPELPEDRGVGNAFIGTGFADPSNRSWIDNLYIAHWPEA
jgi:hypothetical protein